MKTKLWRLKWVANEISRPSKHRSYATVLKSPASYWLTLLLKFIPNFNNSVRHLTLKDGKRFLVRDFMTLYIFNEIFIEGCYDFPDLKKPDPVILDIGANTGLFTLRMKQIYSGAQIYGFEPFPRNFADLSENIKLSKLDNVTIFQKAVGGKPGTDRLFINKSNNGGHSLYSKEAGSSDFVNVDITTLATIFNELRLDFCDMIKMDCEGSEYEILMSITPDLATRIGVIIFESTDSVYDPNKVISHLQSLGYRTEFVEKTCNYVAVKNE